MDTKQNTPSGSLADLPYDELMAYARSLGLIIAEETPAGELLRRVRARQELLLDLDRDALLDIIVWARRPVRQSVSKEELASLIAGIQRGKYERLSARGLRALARLRGVPAPLDAEPAALAAALRKAEGFWTRVKRQRRALAGSLLARLFHEPPEPPAAEYRFLPEERAPSLKTRIEEEGMVGGIARRLRGVADDYVREKLDEIEARIDQKLDEIDQRLAEWRDREVSNRLKILKITLIVSIIVALLGLGYDYLHVQVRGRASLPPQETRRVERGSAGEAGTAEGIAAPSGGERQGDVRTTQ
jgi:hypothetical protein